MAQQPTERVYGVQLLDDIHNYFPELLYNSSRFHNVQDVLQYIVANTRRRFDLFSHGSGLYRASQPVQPVQPVQQTQMPISLSSIFESIYTPQPISVQPASTDDIASGLILSLLGSSPVTYSRTFLDPIPIIPTREQIQSASTVSVISIMDVSHTNDICSICQDPIVVRNKIRRLNACNHTFHINCIDTWFSQNVRCPVCRHDIRDVRIQQSATDTKDEQENRELVGDSEDEEDDFDL